MVNTLNYYLLWRIEIKIQIKILILLLFLFNHKLLIVWLFLIDIKKIKIKVIFSFFIILNIDLLLLFIPSLLIFVFSQVEFLLFLSEKRLLSKGRLGILIFRSKFLTFFLLQLRMFFEWLSCEFFLWFLRRGFFRWKTCHTSHSFEYLIYIINLQINILNNFIQLLYKILILILSSLYFFF